MSDHDPSAMLEALGLTYMPEGDLYYIDRPLHADALVHADGTVTLGIITEHGQLSVSGEVDFDPWPMQRWAAAQRQEERTS